MPVDYTGTPADYDTINQIASAHGIRVIADAAHSLGATYKGRNSMTLADASICSFHAVKTSTRGEGGAVFTNDPKIDHYVKQFRTHGFRATQEIRAENGDWYYEMEALGYNYRLSDIHCALGISQLKKRHTFAERRCEIAEMYYEALSDIEEIELPPVFDDRESSWHLFVIRLKDSSRRKPVFDKLRELGLFAQVHYIPVYYHPYYQKLGYPKGLCPHAESWYERCISIPLFPKIRMLMLSNVSEA